MSEQKAVPSLTMRQAFMRILATNPQWQEAKSGETTAIGGARLGQQNNQQQHDHILGSERS